MSDKLSQSQAVELEQLIDKSSLECVLANIAQICIEKSHHVESNWQDRRLARLWEKAARAVDKLSEKPVITILP